MEVLYTRYPALEACRKDIEAATAAIIETYKNGGKVLLCGNGGSCADCDHIVGELMKGFMNMRKVTDERLPEDIRSKLQGALPAISLPSQSGVFTAFINDVDPDMVHAQLLYGYAREGDLFIGISTSGNSRNVVNAARVARAIGLQSIALTGEGGGELSQMCDVTIRVPECETYKVQELHLPVYHYLCAAVEEHFFG